MILSLLGFYFRCNLVSMKMQQMRRAREACVNGKNTNNHLYKNNDKICKIVWLLNVYSRIFFYIHTCVLVLEILPTTTYKSYIMYK